MERTYTIPLRKDIKSAPPKRKAKRAISAIKAFITRHMKGKEVALGTELNEHMWQRGMEHPPTKVTVAAKKDEDKVFVNLVGKPLSAKKLEQKSTKKKSMLEEQVEKLKGASEKKEEPKTE